MGRKEKRDALKRKLKKQGVSDAQLVGKSVRELTAMAGKPSRRASPPKPKPVERLRARPVFSPPATVRPTRKREERKEKLQTELGSSREAAKSMVRVGGYSEQGPRDYQEDRWFAQDNLMVVADGMGGHAAGDKAAELAIHTTVPSATAIGLHLWRGQPERSLASVVDQANTEVYRWGKEHGGKPGCTLTVGLVKGRTLYVAHVGDSRLTMVYNDSLRRVTKDHTLVQRLVDKGHISEEEARVHPQRNVIMQAIGIDPTVSVDTEKVPIKVGQTFVITSDGVHDYLTDAQFIRICESSRNPQAVAKKLVQTSLKNGGNDNSTAVVMKIG